MSFLVFSYDFYHNLKFREFMNKSLTIMKDGVSPSKKFAKKKSLRASKISGLKDLKFGH